MIINESIFPPIQKFSEKHGIFSARNHIYSIILNSNYKYCISSFFLLNKSEKYLENLSIQSTVFFVDKFQ